MDDIQLLRYNRQLLLPQIDIEGQTKLADSHLTIVGLGGLGCPAAMYLAAAGVGRLTLIDHDQIELTNLQRQLAYSDQDIGKAKVDTLAELITKLNPDCSVTKVKQRFDPVKQQAIIGATDVVIDATDNIDSRKLINQSCFKSNKPLVFAAAIRMEGQLTVFDPRNVDSPCYECVFGKIEINESCSQSGVLGTVVGTLGLMQATEAIKLVLTIGQSPVGTLQIYDALSSEWQSIKISKRPDCPVCG